MSVDGTDSAVLDAPGGEPSAPSAQPTSSPAPSAAPPAAGPGSYGDADLDNSPTIAPPRERGPDGRYLPRGGKPSDEPAAAAPAQPAPAQPATPPAPQDWLTADLKQQADYYGFDEREARIYGSPEGLLAALTAQDRRALRTLAQPQQPSQGQVPPAGYQAPAQPVAPAPQAPSGFDLAKYKDTFDPETLKVLGEWDQSLRSELQKRDALLEAQRTQYEQISQQFQALQAQAEAAEARRVEAELDGQFDSLGKEYEDLFGKGSIRELAPAFQAKRQEFAAYMDKLAEIDAQAGRHPAPAKLVFQRVLRTMYGDRQEQAIRNQVAQEVAQRKAQSIARPTARTSAPANPLEAAARRADEIYRKAGFEITDGGAAFDGVI